MVLKCPPLHLHTDPPTRHRKPALCNHPVRPAQPTHVTALDLPAADPLPPDIVELFDKCQEKLGLIANVLRAYSFAPEKLRAFNGLYNDLMLADSGLSKLEREMIAVVVSSINRCFYCLTAHGAAVRALSGDPVLGELLAFNYRAAQLSPRHRAMLDFAAQMTTGSDKISESEREALRTEGFSDRDIWDIAAVAGFFNMTNRLALAVDLQPNSEYQAKAR